MLFVENVKVQKKHTHQRKRKGKTVRHVDLVDHLLLLGHDLLQDHLVNHLLDHLDGIPVIVVGQFFTGKVLLIPRHIQLSVMVKHALEW